MRIQWLVLGIAGCTVPPPFHTLETASTLPGHGVALMIAGGGGGGEDLHSCCGGVAARARLGIGGDQEIGIDANTIFSNSDVMGGFRLGYKRGLSPHVAVTAGTGMFFIPKVQTVGLDLGAIFSAADGDGFVPYTAVRVSGAIPTADVYDVGGISQTLAVPLGVSKRFGAHWKAMAEAGFIGALSEGHFGSTANMITTQTNLGGYGALAIGWER